MQIHVDGLGSSTAHNEEIQRPTDDTELEEALLFYLDHPVEWAEDNLNVEFDPWQVEALEALAVKRFVAVRSGHGVGKSFTVSNAILWFLTTHPFCKVVCTAPTKEQLFDILWAECAARIRESEYLRGLLDHRKDTIVVRGHEKEWFALARTAEVRKQGKTGLAVAEGLQGRHAESLLLILDEASGIDETIMNTVDGALTSEESYVLMTGNPTRSSGTFYDAFHTKRKLWHCIHVNSEQSPRVSKDWCERMEEKYGSRDHPLYLIRVRGDFPPAQHNSVFDLGKIETCMSLDIKPSPYDLIEIGLDVARYGGSKTVFAIKQGAKIIRIDAYEHGSTMETVGRTIQYINHLHPYAIKVDVVGVGGGVVDRLHELGYKEVIPINNGDAPTDTKAYINKRAEAYWHLRTLLEQSAINLPVNDDLTAQMTAITYEVTSRGKIKIESKEDLLDRGVKSPDELDAVVLACLPAIPMRQRGARVGVVPFMAR